MDRPAYRDFDAAAPSLRRARPNIFARIVRLILEGPLYVVLIWVALAAAGSTYSALTTTLDFTGTGLVALDPELASAERALEAAFPGTGEPIVAVIDSDDPKAARDAAANLARAFAGEPHIFSAAYAPGTEQFFDRYGVLYLDRAEVENTVRRIEQSAPLYRAIAASPDFAGLAALAGEAARAIAGGRSPQGLNALFQEAALTVRGEIEGHRHDLDWPGLVKHAAGPDSKHWYVLTTPLAAKGEADPYGPAVGRARALADEITANTPGVTSVTLTGRPVLAAAWPGSSARALLLPALAAALLVMIILACGLSRLGLIAVLIVALALAFMAFAGAAALIAPRLDRVTVSVPLIYFGLAMLAMTGLMLRVEEYENAGAAGSAALMLAAHRLGPAILAWTVAISLGTIVAGGSSFTALAKLALMTAAAALIVFLAALTLLPALLAFTSPSQRPAEARWLDMALAAPAPSAWRTLRQSLVAILLAVAVWFTVLLPEIRIDVGGKPDQTAGRAAQLFDEVAAREPALRTAAEVLAKPEQEASTLAVRLATLPEVASVRWIDSFLPPGEGEKRQILARLDGVLPKLPEQSAETEDGRLRAELSRLEQHLLGIANDPKTEGDLKSAASEFRRSLALFDSPNPASPEAMRRLENALFVRLPLLLDDVERLSNLPPLSFSSLDPELVRRFVAPDGSWRIEVVPRDPNALQRFADAVRAIAPNAAGQAIIDAVSPRLMLAGLGYAVAGIFAVSFFAAITMTGSILAGLRVIVPPALVMLIAAAGLVFTGRRLVPEEISLIVATIALLAGAGFIAERWNGYASAWIEETPAALPRAILIAYLTFAAAFAPFMVSPGATLRDFGEFVAVAAGLQLLASFLVAPELARWTRRRRP